MRDHTKIRAFELDNEMAVLIYAEMLKAFSLNNLNSYKKLTDIENAKTAKKYMRFE